MDGSVSVSAQSTERTRDQVAQLLGKRTVNSARTNSSLFEQLLSIPVAPQSLPPQSDSIAPETTADESSAAIQKAADPPESAADDAEDDTDSDTAIPLLAIAAANLDSNALESSEPAEAKLETESQLVEAGEHASPRPPETIATTTTDEGEAVQAASAIVPNRETEMDEAGWQAPAAVQSNEPSQSLNQPLEELPMGAQEVRSKGAIPDAGKQVEVTGNPIPDSAHQRASASQPVPISEQNAKVQGVAAERTASTELPAADASSRRSNRREKWFERDAKSDASLTSTGNDIESASLSQADKEYGNSDVLVSTSQALAPSTGVNLDDVSMSGTQPPAVTTLGLLPGVAQPANSLASSVTSAVSKSDAGSSNSITTRFTAGQSSSTATTASAQSQTKDQANRAELTQQERVRLIQRVSRSFNRITSQGGQINLRLHPQNLGSLNMQVRIEGRTLSAKLTTETSAARDAILQDLPALRQRLADQGYDVAKFQVEVAENGSDASFAQTGGQSQYSQTDQSGYKPGGYEMDYRRMASRSFELPNTASSLTTTNLSLQTTAGIDLNA